MASPTKRKSEVRFLNGDFALVPRAEYNRLLEIEADAAEDEAASRIIRETELAIKEGREVVLPREVADRLIAGENPVLVMREWRNIGQADLAAAANLSRANLAEIEKGRRAVTAVLQKRLARALNVPPGVFLD